MVKCTVVVVYLYDSKGMYSIGCTRTTGDNQVKRDIIITS